MNGPLPEPIERLTLEAATLVAGHPPVLRHTNKLAVHAIAVPEGAIHSGQIGYTRWPARALPATATPSDALALVQGRPTIYTYEPEADLPGAVEWHVNFADPLLFFAYGSALFAQDELQTAEHPALGSLVELLRAGDHRGMTEDEEGPTPVLVTGVERRCVVAIDVSEAGGRPRGLYGNEFSAASVETVRRATKRLDPPTTSNLIAIAAPAYGMGPYARETVERILVTAFTGFAAAKTESASLAPGKPVVVKTGFWGCGVFGGDRVLMTLLQVLAAAMAGVDRLVFHTVTAEGLAYLDEANALIKRDLGGTMSAAELVDRVTAMGFHWGMSDGR